MNSEIGVVSLQKLRKALLKRCGNSISAISHAFKQMDDNRDRKLDYQEFADGLKYNLQIEMTAAEIKAIESIID